jgi:Xaa-Pro aminopeptidase
MDIPFDHRYLDELMEGAGVDALLVTSKHNVQYLLGGHRFFWFDHMDAVGVSRYLPVLIYLRGRADASYYIGYGIEDAQLDNDPVWVKELETTSWGVGDAIGSALTHLRQVLPAGAVVGIEPSFLPTAASRQLSDDGTYSYSSAEFVLERLRAVKSPRELELVVASGEKIVDSILATIDRTGPGYTKRDIVHILHQEEASRGLTFEYVLISMGASFNRGPSDQVWQPGEVLCLDSGGNYHGYIGDLARMGVAGEPDAELEDLLAEIETIQRAARAPIRAGNIGQEIYDAAGAAVAAAPSRTALRFLAHGMGLISHEAPRLTSAGPIPYPNEDGPRPLETGMVLSIETTMFHPTRGFIKLEDTVLVTEDGGQGVGDHGRGWNVAGAELEQRDAG